MLQIVKKKNINIGFRVNLVSTCLVVTKLLFERSYSLEKPTNYKIFI